MVIQSFSPYGHAFGRRIKVGDKVVKSVDKIHIPAKGHVEVSEEDHDLSLKDDPCFVDLLAKRVIRYVDKMPVKHVVSHADVAVANQRARDAQGETDAAKTEIAHKNAEIEALKAQIEQLKDKGFVEE